VSGLGRLGASIGGSWRGLASAFNRYNCRDLQMTMV
jgi:hypothetical protein